MEGSFLFYKKLIIINASLINLWYDKVAIIYRLKFGQIGGDKRCPSIQNIQLYV